MTQPRLPQGFDYDNQEQNTDARSSLNKFNSKNSLAESQGNGNGNIEATGELKSKKTMRKGFSRMETTKQTFSTDKEKERFYRDKIKKNRSRSGTTNLFSRLSCYCVRRKNPVRVTAKH